MPEKEKLTKAQKLAAARKKLKEYQQRNNDGTTISNTKTATNAGDGGGGAATAGGGGYQTDDISSTVSTSSNLSERSESELNLNGHPQQQMLTDIRNAINVGNDLGNDEAPLSSSVSSYFTATAPAPEMDNLFNTISTAPVTHVEATANEQNAIYGGGGGGNNPPDANLNTIQVLITEKSQLNAELTKLRRSCRERELELEELRVQFQGSNQREKNLNAIVIEHQQSTEQLRKNNAELQHKLAQFNAQGKDHQTHVAELQQQLTLQQIRVKELEQQNQAKCNELEMAQLRVRQLSDESNVSADNRIETLTQTQYMYEQQIRDLQAMVQQLTQDKEQANLQYQTYAQHLNGEINKLNERNSELSEDCVRLQERERQLVEHVSGLEREIQKNLNLQAQFKAANQTESTPLSADDLNQELAKLNERISDFDYEKHEFQLKIKSQDDKLIELQQQLIAKDETLSTLQDQIERLQSEQPDQTKLLATMESDKVAASRALTQNIELKKQLDELELRFVQLTNDKAELVNKLDAEEFAHRELRTSFEDMEEKLKLIDERFKFKDEEMIRLSHENVELSKNNLILQQQIDRLKHYEVKDYHKNYLKTTMATKAKESCDSHELHHHNDEDGNSEHHHHHDHQRHEHEHDHEHTHSAITELEDTPHTIPSEHGVEATEDCVFSHVQHNGHQCYDHDHDYNSTQLDHSEAVEKLQGRFTQLISQVADLTDDKQRLEHLVLQLQSETETIGEYIALYQTQRRMLKQREYEKAAQMKLLEIERQQLREKITMLNNLVSSLGVESLPKNNRVFHDKLKKTTMTPAAIDGIGIDEVISTIENLSVIGADEEEEDVSTSSTAAANENELLVAEHLHSNESQQILHKIQDIITEIKENTEQQLPTVQHTIDHLNCCLGKVQVV